MGEKVLKETQEGLHSREIINTAGESRKELRSMIRQVIAVEFGSRRAPRAAKEGESARLRRLGRTAPGLVVPGLLCGSEA